MPSASKLIKACTEVRTMEISRCYTLGRTPSTFGAIKTTVSHQLEHVDALKIVTGCYRCCACVYEWASWFALRTQLTQSIQRRIKHQHQKPTRPASR